MRYELSTGYSVFILKSRFFCGILSVLLSAQLLNSVNALQFVQKEQFCSGSNIDRDVSAEKEYNISGQLVGAAAGSALALILCLFSLIISFLPILTLVVRQSGYVIYRYIIKFC